MPDVCWHYKGVQSKIFSVEVSAGVKICGSLECESVALSPIWLRSLEWYYVEKLPQAVQLLTENLMLFDSEFVKIFDGNGTEVFSLHGWVSSSDKNVREISFGESKNITIQVSLVYSWTYVKIDYGTLNRGLDSGKEGKKHIFLIMEYKGRRQCIHRRN